jgi:hypothetical protein
MKLTDEQEREMLIAALDYSNQAEKIECFKAGYSKAIISERKKSEKLIEACIEFTKRYSHDFECGHFQIYRARAPNYNKCTCRLSAIKQALQEFCDDNKT